MLQAIQGWLALLAPLAFAAAVSVIVRRKVAKPSRFFWVAASMVLAVQAAALFLFAGLLPPGEPDAAYVQVGWFVAAVTAALVSPLLWFTYRRMHHVPGSFEGA